MLDVKFEDDLLILTIDKAPANALDNPTLRDLVARLDEAYEAGPRVRGVMLTGAGDRFFTAGGDVKEFATLTREGGVERVTLGSRLKTGLARLECPYVAAVNGTAIGSGVEVSVLADFCVASETARFGMPEINHGLLPMARGIQQLVRVTGEKNAKKILFSGEIFGATEAKEYGIVDELVAPEDVKPRAMEWLKDMAAKPPQLFSALKRSIRDTASSPLTDDQLEEMTKQDLLSYFGTPEAEAELQTLLER